VFLLVQAYPGSQGQRAVKWLLLLLYLPKNMTSLMQPLEQGITAMFKKSYRCELISNIISGGKSVTEFLWRMPLKDFVYFGATAWRLITAQCFLDESIGSSFQ